MRGKIKNLLKFMLYSVYIELLFLYLILFLSVLIPILVFFITTFGRIIKSLMRNSFINAIANFTSRLIADDNLFLLGIIFISIILFIVFIVRSRKGTFSDSLLLYKLFRNHNKDFNIGPSLYLPIALTVIYFFISMISSGSGYFFVRLIIVSILSLTLLSYADQINIIMMNIKDIGSSNRINNHITSGFTKKSLTMLDNIDNNIQESIENQLKSERLKTELITNISHDLKTPLTSIINYTDLLKKQEFEDGEINNYISILDRNSQRLKVLITDLVEASKTETGNIILNPQELELNELIFQIYGEFDDVFRSKGISFVFNPTEDYLIFADGSHLGRVIENIMSNASKYSQENTRVYAMTKDEGEYISLVIKNTSSDELNITPDELMERFVRGERSRHTEGSGLGLYIARNLMELMHGDLSLSIDGDLFAVKLLVPKGAVK